MKEKEKIEILEKIDLYIRGKLSQDEIDELWIIFLTHPESYEWFETELHLRSLARKGNRPQWHSVNKENSNVSSLQPYKKWLYAAAAAVLIAIGLQFFAHQQPDAIPSLALSEIDQAHLIGAEVLRSDSDPAENIDVAINRALAMAYEGKTEAAIEEFENILDQTTNEQQRARVEMNAGILLYNNGGYEPAKDHFLAVTEIKNLPEHQEEKAWWFLGNSYLNLNQPLDAREAVFNAYSLNGRYQSAALALLKKLDQRLGNIPSDEQPAELGD